MLLVDRMRALTGEGAAEVEPGFDLLDDLRVFQARETELHDLRQRLRVVDG